VQTSVIFPVPIRRYPPAATYIARAWQLICTVANRTKMSKCNLAPMDGPYRRFSDNRQIANLHLKNSAFPISVQFLCNNRVIISTIKARPYRHRNSYTGLWWCCLFHSTPCDAFFAQRLSSLAFFRSIFVTGCQMACRRSRCRDYATHLGAALQNLGHPTSKRCPLARCARLDFAPFPPGQSTLPGSLIVYGPKRRRKISNRWIYLRGRDGKGQGQ